MSEPMSTSISRFTRKALIVVHWATTSAAATVIITGASVNLAGYDISNSLLGWIAGAAATAGFAGAVKASFI